MMIKIKINSKEFITEEGTSVLKAARKAGIQIPALCYFEGIEPFTSCMICLVKDTKTGSLFPSCSHQVYEGMEIITDDEEIVEARRTGLELLLSEHVGDCEAPCTVACPANMNIPRMNRLLEEGELDKALEVVRKDIALPGVLGRICPAPCEGACKRKPIDGSVSICLLKRYAGDHGKNPVERKTPDRVKKVAIIGSGPAGLAAAYYLQLEGFQAEVYDKHPLPGGNLRYAIPDDRLPKDVLDREIQYIQDTGVNLIQHTPIDAKRFDWFTKDYDAVVIATGDFDKELDEWGLDNNGKQLQVNKPTFQTNFTNVFAAGNVTRSSKLAIRSLAQGKDAAHSVRQYLEGEKVTGREKRFNSRFGKLFQGEFNEYLKGSTDFERFQPKKGLGAGFSHREMVNEASRCMHCDCRKPDNCKLRDFAEEYQVKQKRFDYSTRNPVSRSIQEDMVVYEPGKCIKCGICVRLTAQYREEFGLTFIGRGFDVKIGVPFNKDLKTGLAKTARLVAEACPTGALSTV
jgi:ferredoxin